MNCIHVFDATIDSIIDIDIDFENKNKIQNYSIIRLYFYIIIISEIPKEKYENIFKGAYERPEKYVEMNKTRKIKKLYK